MAARHSTGRRRAANSHLNQVERLRGGNGRQMPYKAGASGRKPPAGGIDGGGAYVAGRQQMQLMAGYALLSLIVEGLQYNAPPFNDPTNPLCQRAIKLARDIVGAGLAGETPPRLRRRSQTAGRR